jgi:superoxide reductase
MAEFRKIYKCELCGNIVEVVHVGGGSLVCCGKPMQLVVENTVEASKEKHIPVIEKLEDGFKVKVGSVDHPMEEKHYIEWIELNVGNRVYRKYLNPGDKPEACFKTCTGCETYTAKAYCNLHGYWKNEE